MMKIRRLLSFALMMCLTAGSLPVSVYAEEQETETPVIADNVSEESLDTQAVTATAPTKMWVEPSDANGIPVQIDVFKMQTGGSTWNPTYTYQLYLPGNVNPDSCMLSWDGDAAVTVDNVSYSSGTCPVPPVNTTKTYAFKNGSQTLASWNIITYQGSADVQAVYIDIDESQGTIAAMDGDSDHETECVGRINIGSTWYDMPKIKGRGNATWTGSKDKRPYNVTLGSKIVFPGIASDKTKKWSFLAEITDHSLLCNRTGLYLANEIGIGQDTASADVWMNGEYQGCYTITPKTDSFVSKDGFMIEQDNYLEKSVAEGGDPQFKLEGLNESSGWSSAYNRITVKKIGDNLLLNNGAVDESVENIEAVAAEIQSWLQDAWDAIRSDTGYNSKGKYYTDYIDMESFAKMYLVHEYIKSYDVCAGSILFHRDGMSDDDKLIAGPLWDVDNALGSTCRNNSLGKADDRSNGDRRSGEGSFISNVTEYKTSIYKTISKHEDFMTEVYNQYNKYRSVFRDLSGFVDQKRNEIQASAVMNHYKVNDLTGTYVNVHKYSSATTLGSGDYRQSYLATTNSKSDWANYAANLKTYVSTRSLWFDNTYYDPDYVPPCEHTDLTDPVWTWSEDCSAATVTFECADCSETVSFEGTIVNSVLNEDDTAVFTAECVINGVTYTDTKTANAFIASFIKDEGVERVDVYYTQDYSEPDETDAQKAAARDSSTGNPVIDGSGQLNFQVVLKNGYLFSSLTATEGTYKNIKVDPEGTENTLLYRITKVTGNTEITISTEKCEHTDISDPAWTWSEDYSSAVLSFDCAVCGQTIALPAAVSSVLDTDGKTIIFTSKAELNGIEYTDTKTASAFIASFEKDEHVKINVYYTDDTEAADETDAAQTVARDSVTGNPVINGDGQISFEVVPDEGYELLTLDADGSFESLEDPEETGKQNTYRITKIAGDLLIRITARKLPVYIDSASLSLKEKIEANFYIYVPSDELDKTDINVTFDGKTVTKPASDYTPKTRNGRECRFVSVPTFAKQMRDNIKITVNDTETGELKYLEYKGQDVTEGLNFKVEDYVKLVDENSEDTDLIDLVHKMDNYGKYAQIQFNYNLDSFDEAEAIENFDDSRLEQYAVSHTGTAEGIEYAAGSLMLESDTGLRVYYNLTGTDAISDYTFIVDGAEAVTPVKKGSQYYVAIKGIPARLMHKAHTVTVTDKAGNTLTTKYSGLTYTYSVVSNASAPDTLKDLCRSIYLYWEAANLYFKEAADS